MFLAIHALQASHIAHDLADAALHPQRAPANRVCSKSTPASAVMCAGACRYVEAGLLWSTQDRAAVQRHIECVEDTHSLRSALPGLGLVAFVGNGSILPRQAAHPLVSCPPENAAQSR